MHAQPSPASGEPAQELAAPADWHTIDFISDLHLHDSAPETFLAWQRYMQQTPAQAHFILGDLFEVWVGDDSCEGDSFEGRCVQALRQAAQRMDLFFICGNRDFLVGPDFGITCGLRRLGDPTVLDFAGQRWLLSHGDALCLADTEYQGFRALVRSPAWQQDFLGRPLATRRQMARELRERSDARRHSQVQTFDVDPVAAAAWLQAAGANCLIHGHTHRPAEHRLGESLQRVVLSDWDMHAAPARAEVLRIERAIGAAVPTVRRLAAA